jgi:serine/threonine protein kinase HipA of HipAB toxin-antitoxin module
MRRVRLQNYRSSDGKNVHPQTLRGIAGVMIFNIAAANCDDHSRSFSLLFDSGTGWQLAPAYDVTYASNSESEWVHQHLMSVNGRFQGITRADTLEVAERLVSALPR